MELINFEKYEVWGDDVIAAGKDLINKIFADNAETKIAVLVNTTDDVGRINEHNIYIFNSYAAALNCINKFEYTNNCAVEVVELDKLGHTHMLQKYYDSACYSRLAQPKHIDYSVFDVRELFDTSAKVYMD
jgi:hypothetical protein